MNLEKLSFMQNEVDSVSALAILHNLRQVNFAGNRVTQLTPLSGDIKLEDIQIFGNPLTDCENDEILEMRKGVIRCKNGWLRKTD